MLLYVTDVILVSLLLTYSVSIVDFEQVNTFDL